VLANAEPIELFLEKPDFSEELKTKIRFVQNVREFAVSELGMTDTENYTTLYDQKGRSILWVVTAAPEFSLEPYQWSFPFAGRFPYKGYFDKDLVKAEANKMKQLGYDVQIDDVSAWSTLGWFSDPILSNNLKRSYGSLANLIIHELTHATIYVKDSAEMNENLASFIGHRGAIAFLSTYPGGDSMLFDYENNRRDVQLFKTYMKGSIEKLSTFYENSHESTEVKRAKKDQLIQEIRNGLYSVEFSNPKAFKSIKDGSFPLNNAYFSGFNTYNKQQNNFETLLLEKYDGDLKAFLNFFKQKYPTL
jgi:predicted aminopeptidase